MFFAARCRIVALAFPVFIGFLSGSLGMGASICLCAGSSYGIAVLPETSHREPDTPSADHSVQLPTSHTSVRRS
jgi:hypothetical protein